jgi:hypothetical protein
MEGVGRHLVQKDPEAEEGGMSALADLTTAAEAYGDAKKALRDRTRAYRRGDDRSLMEEARNGLLAARDGLLASAALFASSTRKRRRAA